MAALAFHDQVELVARALRRRSGDPPRQDYRRAIPRGEYRGSRLEHLRSTDPRVTCRATITLDGTTYRCGRVTVGPDAQRGLGYHEGIHDAFCEHHDLGAVRW
jgi:hypothetical protein